jgi:hypothetical protein
MIEPINPSLPVYKAQIKTITGNVTYIRRKKTYSRTLGMVFNSLARNNPISKSDPQGSLKWMYDEKNNGSKGCPEQTKKDR